MAALRRIAGFCLLVILFSPSHAAEQPGWRPVFEDDFARKELGPGWTVADGEWTLGNGSLVCPSGGLLVLSQELQGCQRLEFEAISDSPGDLSPVIHSDGRRFDSGYFLQFGGMNNTMNKARRLREFITLDREHMIEPGKWHHVVGEFDGRHVRLTVDGKHVHEYLERDAPLVGDGHRRAGIYVYRQGRIRNAKVYTKPFVPRAVDPSAAGTDSGPLPDGNLLRGGDAEKWDEFVRWGGGAFRNTTDPHSGKACFELRGIGSVTSPGLIEIDWSKTYELSGWFKSVRPGQPSRVLFDIRFFTADKRAIGPHNTCPVSSVSKLLAAASAGDTVLPVAEADWPLQGRMSSVAFHAKADLSDLPNFEVVPLAGIGKTAAGYQVSLRKPLEEAYPAGTGVRLHRYLDFPRVAHNKTPYEWTRYSFTIAKDVPPGRRVQDCFWPGAKYVRFVIIHQYTSYPEPLPEGEEPPLLRYDDIVFREVRRGTAAVGKER